MDAQTVQIRSVEPVGTDTIAIELETPPGFDALPGQFVLVRVTVDGEEHPRHYTLSSSGVGDTFEITVGIEPDGAVSGWLADRESGDTLTIEGPFGEVAYDDEGAVRVLAGGPGMGAGIGVAERAAGLGHDVAVIAEHDGGGLVHPDRFTALAAGHRVFVTTTPSGFTEGVAAAYTAVPDGTTFVFGFRPFVERAAAAIEDAGGDPDDALIENYG